MKNFTKKLIVLTLIAVGSISCIFAQESNEDATLIDGPTLNVKLKTLAAGKSQQKDNWENKITTIAESKTKPGNSVVSTNISTSETTPIRAWFNNGTLYYYTDAKKIYMNPNSSEMFYRFTKLSNISPLQNRDTSKVTNMESMFASCYELTNVSALSNRDVSNVTNMKDVFASSNTLTDISGLSKWNTSNVKDMTSLFHNVKNLRNISALANWDVHNVEKMSDLFYDCDLTDVTALANWDTQNTTQMDGMFARSENLTNISALKNWNTSNVKDMHNMFYCCKALKDISALANWDVRNVEKMGSLFSYNTSLENISALSNWKTEKLTDMAEMFRGDSNLKEAFSLGEWNTSKVTDMDFLFEGCSNIIAIDLTNRDTSKVRSMHQMFKDCKKLKAIFASEKFTTANVNSKNQGIWDGATELFDGATELVGGNGTKYSSAHTDKTYARMDTENAPGYFSKREAVPNITITNEDQKGNEETQSTHNENTNTVTTNNNTITNNNGTTQTPNLKKWEKSEGNPKETLWNGYTRELNNAFQFARSNGITTANTIDNANIEGPLTRIAMAKMLSNYAINILGQQPDASLGVIYFDDVTPEQNSKYDQAVTLAYQLGIMGKGTKYFRPYDEVTRAEFATALSRMLYSTPDGTPYYESHLNKLKFEGIINNTTPTVKEKRGNAMLMLMRTTE